MQYPLGRPPGPLFMPRLVINEPAWNMIRAYTRINNTEINGFCFVTVIDGGRTFFVASPDDVLITEQTVTVGSAEATGDGYAHAFHDAIVAGRADQLRIQWHSHPGDVYFSTTDLDNIEDMGGAGVEWFISLVVNRDDEMRARFDAFRPVRFGGEMQVQVRRPIDAALIARAGREVADKVTVKPLITVKTRRKRQS